jgi:hypothetical protein
MERFTRGSIALGLLLLPILWAASVAHATALEGPEGRMESISMVEDSNTPAIARPSEVPTPSAPPIVWKPRVVGAPGERVGGAVRGSKAPVNPLVLVPDNLALTLKPAPSLFWHLDAAALEGVKVIFTLVDETAEVPLVEAELAPPGRPGIQRVRLADYGVELEKERPYTWSIALVPDMNNRGRDRISQAVIQRTPISGEIPREATEFAARGLWYDALEALSDTIEAEPENAAARAQRRSLLAQAGIVIGGQ